MLHLAKLAAEAFNFTKTNMSPWIFFSLFFKLYKWYQMAQSILYIQIKGTSNKSLIIIYLYPLLDFKNKKTKKYTSSIQF